MNTLSQIEAPHEVQDADKLAALVSAYEAGELPPPVLVLDGGEGRLFAVTGSHRINAMRTAYDADLDIVADLADEIVVVGLDDVVGALRAAEASRAVVNALDVLDNAGPTLWYAGMGPSEIIDALAELPADVLSALHPRVAEAIDGQA